MDFCSDIDKTLQTMRAAYGQYIHVLESFLRVYDRGDRSEVLFQNVLNAEKDLKNALHIPFLLQHAVDMEAKYEYRKKLKVAKKMRDNKEVTPQLIGNFKNGKAIFQGLGAGEFNVVREDGTLLFAESYELIQEFGDGYLLEKKEEGEIAEAGVKKRYTRVVIHTDSEGKILNSYPVESVGTVSDNGMVIIQGLWSAFVLNPDGSIAFDGILGRIGHEKIFSEGKMRVQKYVNDGTSSFNGWMYLTGKGKPINNEYFGNAQPFSCGRAWAGSMDFNMAAMLYNKILLREDGAVIGEYPFKKVTSYCSNVCVAIEDGDYGFLLDLQGNKIRDLGILIDIEDFQCGVLRVKVKSSHGGVVYRYLNTQGDFINDEEYKVAAEFKEDLAYVTTDLGSYFINTQGKKVHKGYFNFLQWGFVKGMALVGYKSGIPGANNRCYIDHEFRIYTSSYKTTPSEYFSEEELKWCHENLSLLDLTEIE